MTITERLSPFIETPHFEDDREQVRAYLLNMITLAVLVILLFVPFILLLTRNVAGESLTRSAAIPALVLMVVIRFFLFRKQLVAAGYSLLIGGFLLLAYHAVILQGLNSPHFMATILLAFITVAVLGIRQAIITVGAIFLLGVYLYFFGNNEPLPPITMLVLIPLFSIFAVVIVYGIFNNLYRALDQVKAANEKLRQTQAETEQRIAVHTRTLENILSLSRELSLILDQDDLLREMVERVRAAFDYYYTQIYLLDGAGATLTLVAGTGPAGQKLLAAGHSLSIGEGLVGQAAQENRPVLVPNVQSSGQWLPNPQLPETRTEAVLPISVGDRVLGVLDVQHHTADSLTEEDVSVLQAMANQAAIALQNAGLYTAAAQRARREAQINALSAQIQQANSIETVLQIAAEGLGKALATKRATVYLQPASNPEQQIPETNGERK